ncbi:hypothetical protein EDB92DRAFT_2113656 [Lactarius akahatsu]|uniref:Uncharacterized protein n=1 Tax=Lactarius akahatsu TaxID=416441 RepID=A0AAD4LJN7_9AGAM|nr:hypothetical protein EDB92DRAFT_2113656 [Lactarius akahatsu]
MTKSPFTSTSPPPKRPTASRARMEESPSSDDLLQFDIPTLEELYEHERFGSVDNFVDVKTFLVNIEIEDQRHDFFTVLQRGAAEGASLAEKKAIVSHNIFWINGPPAHQSTFDPPSAHVLWESQRAIENSWTADFVGKSPLEGLKWHVVELLGVGTSNTTKVYGRYCSIVQPSGMGKSRLLDELSKDLRTQHHERRVNIFLAFDEAHTLTVYYDDQEESRFVVLRWELSSILGHGPLFSFFLSTSSKITQFGQSRGHDNPDRINSGYMTIPRRYIYVGFDQLVQNRKVRRGSTLEDVTSLDFIAHLGRPLWASRYDHGDDEIRNSLLDFALQKLLCTPQVPRSLTEAQVYAVLSQRLALDVNTPQYLLASANPLQLMQATHEQVANHMRVCVALRDGAESLRAVASSEPILLEAASRVMQDSKIFSLPAALALVLTGSCINQGDRGELLVAAFFTWARDKVILDTPPPVLEDSSELPSFYHSKAARRPFGDVFDKAHMHFNHFVKPQEQKLLARRYLNLYMARSAAVLGANYQAGFDAVYPYLYGGTDLDPKKVGFIIVQVKNGQAQADAFPNMDPFKCGFLDESDLEDGKFPIPIIHLLFSLSSTKGSPPSVTVAPPKDTASRRGNEPNSNFTSYDFVCTGVDENILQPVVESLDVWASLVNSSNPWSSFYSVPVPDVLRSQLPGCGTNEGHWMNWVEGL